MSHGPSEVRPESLTQLGYSIAGQAIIGEIIHIYYTQSCVLLPYSTRTHFTDIALLNYINNARDCICCILSWPYLSPNAHVHWPDNEVIYHLIKSCYR